MVGRSRYDRRTTVVPGCIQNYTRFCDHVRAFPTISNILHRHPVAVESRQPFLHQFRRVQIKKLVQKKRKKKGFDLLLGKYKNFARVTKEVYGESKEKKHSDKNKIIKRSDGV